MSVKRIVAVGVIFILSCVAWVVLGSATAFRSSSFGSRLNADVESLWGRPLVQEGLSVAVLVPGSDQVRWSMPSANRVNVELKADHRRKGLIWYPTFHCAFDATYTLTNAEDVTQKVKIHFAFPAADATYDNFTLSLDQKPLLIPVDTKVGLAEIVELQPHQSRDFRVTYKTRGLREWRYRIDKQAGRVQGLAMTVNTSFKDVDYPDAGLSPMKATETGGGMELKWDAVDLITSQDIGIVIPEKLNPGPLTTRITFFAPVCLLFFFLLIGTINILYKVDIHPMHYLFVAAGFFAFHLLLSYMVGLLDVNLSFALSATVSVALVTSYLSAALRGRFPWKLAAAGQLFYLVLFSYSFFWTGVTGLIVAIGSVATLAVLMRVTAHTDWTAVFSGPSAPVPPPIPNMEP